jgi:hypothetical protein
MKHQIVIVLAALIIAAAIVGVRFIPRYEISAVIDPDGTSIAWRVNSLTGDVQICSLARSDNPFEKFAPEGGKQFDVACRRSIGGVAPKP